MPNFPTLKEIGKIPTLYDDITREIKLAKYKDYFQKQDYNQKAEVYQLGSKVGEALRALTLGGK